MATHVAIREQHGPMGKQISLVRQFPTCDEWYGGGAVLPTANVNADQYPWG